MSSRAHWRTTGGNWTGRLGVAEAVCSHPNTHRGDRARGRGRRQRRNECRRGPTGGRRAGTGPEGSGSLKPSAVIRIPTAGTVLGGEVVGNDATNVVAGPLEDDGREQDL